MASTALTGGGGALRAGMDWTLWRLFPNVARWTGRPHAGIDCVERGVENGSEVTIDVDRLIEAARTLVAQVRARGSIR